MDIKQLQWIKKVQREFKNKFGSYLHIDFCLMKGIDMRPATARTVEEQRIEMREYFEFCVRTHGADIEVLRQNQKLNGTGLRKEKAALMMFCKAVMDNNWNREYAGVLINKHRSIVYHYSQKKEKVVDD